MSTGNTDIQWGGGGEGRLGGINHLSPEELGELEIREMIMTLGVTNNQIVIISIFYNNDSSAGAGAVYLSSSTALYLIFTKFSFL